MSPKKTNYSLYLDENRHNLLSGIRHGIPIALGYFAVAFSLGIAASEAGLTAFQGWLTSILCNASAGEYVGFTCIAASAAFLEIGVATLVANARYMLMSCAISQKLEPGLSIWHRMGVAFCLTDEIFGISIARHGYLNPNYTYGAMLISTTGWSAGTALGIVAGNMLPLRLVSAFSVALYGMFLAIIIPPSKQNKVVLGLVLGGFVFSYLASILPVVSDLTEGTRTIILTVVISLFAAILFPHEEKEEAEEATAE
ncbi:MAG: AzlC family ABC transporter permease [Ruminococcaceae bacterium]|nr:AzlC family ABC transporter permease [Oscillospiraceae bacterium]